MKIGLWAHENRMLATPGRGRIGARPSSCSKAMVFPGQVGISGAGILRDRLMVKVIARGDFRCHSPLPDWRA